MTESLCGVIPEAQSSFGRSATPPAGGLAHGVGVRTWWALQLATTGVGVSAWAHTLAGGPNPSVGWLVLAVGLCVALVFPFVRGVTRWWEFLGLSAVLQLVTHGLWAMGSDVAVGSAGAVPGIAVAAHAVGTVLVVALCSTAEALRVVVASWWSVILTAVGVVVPFVTGPRQVFAVKTVWPSDAPLRYVHSLRGPPVIV